MILKEFDLEGKVAIVTGAGRGIGKAIALTMAKAGADIVASARTAEQIEQTAAEVRQLGRRSLSIPTDVCKSDQVEKLAEAAIGQFGKIDILVANAGFNIMKPLLLVEGLVPMRAPTRWDSNLTEQEWDTIINIDLTGVVRCARAVGPHMIKQRRGKIINIGSEAGFIGGANNTVYTVAKAAVHRFTQALALEWAPFNINVNAIAPGRFRTDVWKRPEWHITDEENEASMQMITSAIPLKRWGDVQELGLLAVFLASDASNYITGVVIPCDGGTTL